MEGFTSINEVRAFLSGLKNTKNTKVFLRVEQEGGYNYLCIYLDNTYSEAEVTSATNLEALNGFKKWYQLKMNKI